MKGKFTNFPWCPHAIDTLCKTLGLLYDRWIWKLNMGFCFPIFTISLSLFESKANYMKHKPFREMPFEIVCLNSGIDPIVQILCIITIVIILGAIFSYRICIFWTSHLELTPKMFFFPTQSKLERGDNRSSHTLLIIESNTKKKNVRENNCIVSTKEEK